MKKINHSSRLQKRDKLLMLLGFLGFVMYALFVNGFGPNARVMMSHFQIDSAEQGLILTMQSVGSLSVLIYIALHGERYNKIYAVNLGLLLFGICSVLIGFAPSYIILIFLFMLAGVGLSTVDSMFSSLIPELYPKHKNTLLPLLHAFFGIGAMIAPVFVTLIVNPNIPSTFVRPYLTVGALLLSLSVVFVLVTKRMIPHTPYADMTENRKRVSDNPAEIFKSPKAWLFLLTGFMYFTFSVGLASWLPTYAQEIGIDFQTSGTVLTMFFLGSLIMRFSSPIILKIVPLRTSYIVFTLLSAACVTTAIIVNNVTLMMVLLVIGGFLQGACVAFLVLMSTATFPKRLASAGAIIFMSGSIAAMTAPLWMGAVGDIIGFRIPLYIICAILALSVLPIVGMRN